ncbi:MAG: F0F1 ATP synthase subunit delta [Roseburia faecis]
MRARNSAGGADKDCIDEAFGGQVELYLVNFLKLLCEKKILREFAGCCEEFTRRYNTDHGIVEAVVTGAVKLKDDADGSAEAPNLKKSAVRTIDLTQKTDLTVLAGLRVEMEGRQLDGTVQGRISDIEKRLNEVVV